MDRTQRLVALKQAIESRILVLDGAMGTMLQAYGLKSGGCSEEWNISHSQVVQKIHQEYIKAGADVILTNTFGANRVKLSSFGRENNITPCGHFNPLIIP